MTPDKRKGWHSSSRHQLLRHWCSQHQPPYIFPQSFMPSDHHPICHPSSSRSFTEGFSPQRRKTQQSIGNKNWLHGPTGCLCSPHLCGMAHPFLPQPQQFMYLIRLSRSSSTWPVTQRYEAAQAVVGWAVATNDVVQCKVHPFQIIYRYHFLGDSWELHSAKTSEEMICARQILPVQFLEFEHIIPMDSIWTLAWLLDPSFYSPPSPTLGIVAHIFGQESGPGSQRLLHLGIFKDAQRPETERGDQNRENVTR